MERREQILSYISMAGHSMKHEGYTRRQAIEKVYFLCKENRLKITRKNVTMLIDLEIKAHNTLESDTPDDACKYWKEQKDLFFYGWNK